MLKMNGIDFHTPEFFIGYNRITLACTLPPVTGPEFLIAGGAIRVGWNINPQRGDFLKNLHVKVIETHLRGRASVASPP